MYFSPAYYILAGLKKKKKEEKLSGPVKQLK